ncbi:hypothetical protein DBR11_24395, partial [Pedobacter sp. HMWF019]|uniref:bacteriocin fulvocin C-related protein n=1 Tax=Pedobacter sp. HMWF019 TaxID=2056856 RepID=UPI000D472125
CSKESSLTQLNQEKIDANALMEVRTFTTETSIKLAYETLNSFEREAIWRQNIQHYISNGGLTDVQIGHLNKLLAKLTPEMFDKRDTATIEFANTWVKEALSAFTERQLILMLTKLTLSTKDELSSVGKKNTTQTSDCEPVICPEPLIWNSDICMCALPTEEKPSCNCKSSNSVFTSCTSSNEKCTDLIPLCTRVTFCGFLYLEDCDGRCKIVTS